MPSETVQQALGSFVAEQQLVITRLEADKVEPGGLGESAAMIGAGILLFVGVTTAIRYTVHRVKQRRARKQEASGSTPTQEESEPAFIM